MPVSRKELFDIQAATEGRFFEMGTGQDNNLQYWQLRQRFKSQITNRKIYIVGTT